MAGNSLTLTIFGNAQPAITALQHVASQANTTGSTMSNMSSRLKGALAGAAVGAFAKESIQAFAEAEQSSNKLSQAFERFPKLADSNITAIENIAVALAKKTKFDDDATKAAAANMAQFGLTGKQIERVLPLVQDYAARTGKDLPEAATILGRSFLGQTKALKEVGIKYKSTGDQATDFKNITELLAQKVGGFAEAQGKTAAGQMQILGNRFGELKEAVGGALMPILSGFLPIVGNIFDAIAPLATAIGKVIGGFGDMVGPVTIAGAALVGVVAAGPAILTFLTALPAKAALAGKAMYAALGPVGIAIGAVTLAWTVLSNVFSGGSQQAIDDQNARIKGLTDTLDKNTGAVTNNTRAKVVDDASTSGVLATMTALGLSSKDYTDAVLGNADAAKRFSDSLAVQQQALIGAGGNFKDLQADMQAAGITQQEMITALTTGNWDAVTGKINAYGEAVGRQTGNAAAGVGIQDAFAAAMNKTVDPMQKLDGLGNKVAEQTGAIGDAQKAAAEKATAMGGAQEGVAKSTTKAGDAAKVAAEKQAAAAAAAEQHKAAVEGAQAALDIATAATGPYAAGVKAESDAQSVLARVTDEVTAALNRQLGIVPSLDQAQADASAATDDMALKFRIGEKDAVTFGQAILTAAGKVSTATAGGRALASTTLSVRDKMVALAAATYDNTVKTQGATGATRAAEAAAQSVRKEFIANATKILGNAGAANKLADAYGLVPSVVATKINADATEAQAKAADVKAKTEALNLVKGTSVLDANGKPFDAKLLAANRAKLLDKLASLTANNSPLLASLTVANRATLKDKLAKMLGDATPYFSRLSAANQAKFSDKLAKINGDNTDANSKIRATQAAIDALTGKTVPITYQGVVTSSGGFYTGDKISTVAATGGLFHGPGTGTSDSIDAKVSTGEFITNARATKKHLPLLRAINADVPAFAKGGLVSDVLMRGGKSGGPNFTKMFDAAAAKLAPAAGAALQAAMDKLGLSGGGFSAGSGNWGPPNMHGLAANTLAAEKFGRAHFGISNIGGWSPSGSVATSDHPKGKALDFMIDKWRSAAGIAKGNEVAAYFLQNPNAFGTKYEIWRDRINTGSGWRPYIRSDRGNLTDPTLAHMDHVHVSFLSGPSGPMGSPSTGGSGGGGVPPAGGAESRWYPLMQRVIAAKGFSKTVFPVMAKQMHMESSGNPKAINLWDSNARAGHPSKGLLQFIDSTFQQYADLGYNTNIWDPESQMRAFLNYVPARYSRGFQHLTDIGNRAYARGGQLNGPGTGTSDSLNIRASKGEFLTNARATSKHLSLLKAINADVPAFAAGGQVSAATLAGLSPYSPGQREGITIGGISEINTAVQDWRAAAVDAAQKWHDAAGAQSQAAIDLADAHGQARQNIASLIGEVNKARLGRNPQDIKRAQEQLAAARKTADEEDRAGRLKLAAATRSAQAALREAKATDAKADAGEADFRVTSRLRGQLLLLSRQSDQVSAHLGDARDKLAGIRGDRASLASSVAGSIGGFGGGILGSPDTRRTAADVIRGLQFDQKNVARFTNNLNEARKKGLSADLLGQVAGAGVDGGGGAAAALRGASAAQIRQINAITAKTNQWANVGGALVAGATYDKAMATQTAAVNRLVDKLDRLDLTETAAARAFAAEMDARMRRFSTHDFIVLSTRASKELARR